VIELAGQVGTALDAVNSGDSQAFADCFTPSVGIVDDWGTTFRGGETINAWCADRFVRRGAQIVLVHAYPTEDGDLMLIANIADTSASTACSFLVSLEHDGTIATMRVIG
jgi:hypothetical protein